MIIGLTGVTGFLGQYVLSALQKTPDIRVAALVRHHGLDADPCVTAVVSDDFRNLRASTWLGAGIREMDCVVHLAAVTPKSQGEGAAKPELFQANFDLTSRVLDSLPVAPRRLIFASAVDVYGFSREQAPITESSPIDPWGYYSEAKVACEELCLRYGRDSSTEVMILRYGHMYGPGEEAYEKLIPVTIRRAALGAPLKIFGSGVVLRDFLHVRDAAEATKRALYASTATFNLFNVVRGESVSVEWIVSEIARLSGSIPVMEADHPTSASRHLVFDATRLRRTIGDWAHVSLRDGLREEFDYVKSQL